MNKTLITNARLVNDGAVVEGDLLIEGARIARVGGAIAADGCRVIDVQGLTLMPGMIDSQVHFRDPGLTHKADMTTESQAALAGGITSWFDMPNTRPPTTSIAALEDKFAHAAGRCWGNYAFYLGATNDNLDELRKLAPGRTCGIKCFMGASTGNMLVDDPDVLDAMFRDAGVLIVTHCEDTPTIVANERAARVRYGDQVPMAEHPRIRSAAACYQSSSMAIGLARRHDARLHVLHLTTAQEMALFEAGPLDKKRITAEVCVHHLTFDARDYPEKGGLIKCNPAIKQPADRAALRQALAAGKLDVVATDHAPHRLEEKAAASYFEVPAGLPLVQHAVPMLLELVHDGVLDLPLAVEKMAHAPARLFGVRQRGYLREGYYADLIVVDWDAPHTVTRDRIRHKCGWSPLEGRTLRSQVSKTFVNGELKYDQGAFCGAPNGRRLEFQAA